jgi:hypothetical protein
MKKYIYCNYYSDADPGRREENLRCVYHNLSLPWLDGMIVFLDNPDHAQDIKPDSKITFVTRGQRMTFRDAVQHAHDTLEPDSIFIIINLDIMIENNDAWCRIDRDFFQTGWPHKAMVCKRHNIAADGSLWIEDASWRKGDFCDAYVLATPVAPGLLSEDLDFCVGNSPQCDNTMMYLMHRYYHVYSWGELYRIMHLDLVKRQEIKTGVITNSMTDYRASRRRDQHIDISAYQDWHRLLREQHEPSYLPTWRLHTLSFQISTPDIG